MVAENTFVMVGPKTYGSESNPGKRATSVAFSNRMYTGSWFKLPRLDVPMNQSNETRLGLHTTKSTNPVHIMNVPVE